jgi:hypothetical protein
MQGLPNGGAWSIAEKEEIVSDGESSLNGFIKSFSKSVGDGAEWRLCGGYKIVYQ